MRPDAIDDAVNALREARNARTPIAGLPEGCRPETVSDGYAIQDGFIRAWPDGVAGWKVGATSAMAQQMFSVSEPFCGPVFRAAVFQTPARPPARDFPIRGMECELAFRLGTALPGRPGGHDRDSVGGAVAAVIPAIEVVSTRFRALQGHGVAEVVADGAANGALVLGEERTDWRSLDLAAVTAVATVDGAEQGRGDGSLVLGHPLAALAWLADHLAARGKPLTAGMVVTTGTMTGIQWLEPGQEGVGDFGELGRVSVRFEAIGA